MAFRKVIGMTVATLAFSAVAFGQANSFCTTTNSIALGQAANNIRAEGQTELLPQLTLTCSASAAGSGTFNLLVQIPSVSITSKVTNTSTGITEVSISGPAITNTNSTVFATVAGGVATFSGINVAVANAGNLNFTISNIRVNISALPSAGVFPTSLTASAFVQGTTNTTSGTSSGNGLAVAYVFNAFNNLNKIYQSYTPFVPAQNNNPPVNASYGSPGAANVGAVTGNANYAVCNSTNTSSTSGSAQIGFFMSLQEGFAGAFKTRADETGSGTGAATASSGTRIKIVFNNVPTGLSIYMPTTVAAGNATGAQLAATSSETGSFSAVSAATSPAAVSGLNLFLVPVSGTSATAIYEVTASAAAFVNNFAISVDFVAAANTITNYLTNPTLSFTTSLAPQLSTAASQIPGFSPTATDIVTTNTITFKPCTTTLLFPFVTNANGFETGIAISNTTKDSFSTPNQNGTCTLNFYASGVAGATNPSAVTAPNLAEGANQPYLAGENYAFTLTQALGVNASNPATFQGYIIAQCNFVNAHAFAYILGGLQPGMFVNPNNTAMGYLALVLTRGGGSTETVTF